MGAYVAQKTIKLLIGSDQPVRRCRVGILGLTFKENVPDLRNSRVPDIVAELRQFGVDALVHDPLADALEAEREYGIRLASMDDFRDLHAMILAVPHRSYLAAPRDDLFARLRQGGVVIDVKSAFAPAKSRPAYATGVSDPPPDADPAGNRLRSANSQIRCPMAMWASWMCCTLRLGTTTDTSARPTSLPPARRSAPTWRCRGRGRMPSHARRSPIRRWC